MTCVDTTSKRSLPAKLAAAFAVASVLALSAGAAHADDRGRRGWEDHHEHHWNGGYYRAPPVVYGGGYYAPAPPPVIYGPGIGIALPGINVNIR